MSETVKYLRKFADALSRILWYGALLLVTVTMINVVIARKNDQIPNIAGYSIFRIATGSMEPTIPTGTYILTRKVPADSLKPGDIITYYSQEPVIQGLPNTHRIVEVLRDRERNLAFVTKGDNNIINDDLPVGEDQILGRHVRNMTRMTNFVDFFMQPSVIAVMMLLQAICIMGMSLYNGHLKKQQAREELEAQQALEAKKRELIEAEIRRLQQLDAEKAKAPAPDDGEETSEETEKDPLQSEKAQGENAEQEGDGL